MVYIITKKYEHYNRSLGKYIKSKKHYQAEMAKQGMIPFEKARQIAEKRERQLHKPYGKPSDKAMAIIQTVHNQTPNKQGKIKLSDRTIDGMKELGVCFDPKFKPNGTKGGF